MGAMFVGNFDGVPSAYTVLFNLWSACKLLSKRGMVGLMFSHLVRTNDGDTGYRISARYTRLI
jgi:hypothetical protein